MTPESAYNLLTVTNLNLVRSIAKRYRGRGVEYEDLVNEGAIGLIKAVQRFDPLRGTHFSTYAIWWIRQAITRAIFDQAKLIRLPVHLGEKLTRFIRILNQDLDLYDVLAEKDLAMSIDLISEEEFAQLADKNCPPQALEKILAKARQKWNLFLDQLASPLSLDHPVSSDSDTPFIELVPDSNSPDVEETVVKTLWKTELREIIEQTLNAREALIVRLRLEGLTLDEIGKKIKLTRERIRQIFEKSTHKLKQNYRFVRHFREFFSKDRNDSD